MASVASSQSNMGGPSHHERAAPVSAGSAAAGGTTSGTEDGMVDTSGDADDYDDLPGVGDKRAKRGFSKRVTLRDLERYFEYPIEQVSKMMGVSTTIIKRLCRKYGIKRWPYRQVCTLVSFSSLHSCFCGHCDSLRLSKISFYSYGE